MQKSITSLQNPLVKQIVTLQAKSRERRKTGQFVIEGIREISLALKGKYNLATLLYCAEIISKDVLISQLDLHISHVDLIEISSEVYTKLAYRGSTEGVIAIAKSKDLHISDLTIEKDNPLILVAEAPEKPGNIGALLRTADAASVDGVIIANPKTDIYNPNIIRNSVGCLFTNNIATGSTEASKFMPYHILSHINRNKFISVVNCYCESNKIRSNCRGTRPCFNYTLRF